MSRPDTTQDASKTHGTTDRRIQRDDPFFLQRDDRVPTPSEGRRKKDRKGEDQAGKEKNGSARKETHHTLYMALVTLRASQGGFGDLPALRPEQHRRRQEENSSRDEKYAIFKPHATTGTPSESSQTDGQTNRAHTQPMPRADLFRNRNGRPRDLARAISSQEGCHVLVADLFNG